MSICKRSGASSPTRPSGQAQLAVTQFVGEYKFRSISRESRRFWQSQPENLADKRLPIRTRISKRNPTGFRLQPVIMSMALIALATQNYTPAVSAAMCLVRTKLVLNSDFRSLFRSFGVVRQCSIRIFF